MVQTETGEVAERCGEAKHRFIPRVVQRRNKFAVVPEFTVVAAGALVVFPSVPSVSVSSWGATGAMYVLCRQDLEEETVFALQLHELDQVGQSGVVRPCLFPLGIHLCLDEVKISADACDV